MRVIPRTTITRGVIAYKYAIARATRGILDHPRMGAEPKYRVGDLFLELCICGRKRFELDDYNCILGRKNFEYYDQYTLKGKIEIIVEDLYQIFGQKVYDEKIVKDVEAKGSYAIEQEIEARGRKLTEVEFRSLIKGEISKLFKLEIDLNSKKSITEQTNNLIEGVKKLNYKDNLLIKGSKDLNSILWILDEE